jgi:hypothetical protein
VTAGAEIRAGGVTAGAEIRAGGVTAGRVLLEACNALLCHLRLGLP